MRWTRSPASGAVVRSRFSTLRRIAAAGAVPFGPRRALAAHQPPMSSDSPRAIPPTSANARDSLFHRRTGPPPCARLAFWIRGRIVRVPSDSTLVPRGSRAEPVLARGIGVTILHHPDLSRVGEVAMLLDAGSTQSMSVNRDAPTFRSTSGEKTACLSTRQVSRAELRVEGCGQAGIRLAPADGLRVTVDGEVVSEPVAIPSKRLVRGVIVELSETVALLLHAIDLRSSTKVQAAATAAGQDLVGHSNAIREAWDELVKVSDQTIPVLLRGPSGVGKELAAALIHQLSGRRGRYVCVNMAAIPPTVAASELFGHREGSFSGASRSHQGFFQQADSGTLFLDEIGDTPEAIQPLLLRAVELGVVQPVGGPAQKVDVRLIAATDSNLESAVADGGFRGALLHRLEGYPVQIPALRERLDDVPRLFLHFFRQELAHTGELSKLKSSGDAEPPWVPWSFVRKLCRYPWPGNVRELRNVARQIAIANRGEANFRPPAQLESRLDAAALVPAPSSGAPADSEPAKRSYDADDAEIRAALRANAFHVGRTATHLNVSRGWLSTRMRSCEGVRIAGELEQGDIDNALDGCGHDTKQAALDLEVSERGLVLQMKRLGIIPKT